MVVSFLAAVPSAALACDPAQGLACYAAVAVHRPGADHNSAGLVVVTTGAEPTESAHTSKLVGTSSCTWTTGMMAQRVVNEGVPWTYLGHLYPTKNELPSRVAAPYTVGPGGDGAIYVVANQVLESLLQQGAINARLELHGRLLEVDGIRYFTIM